MSPLTQSHWFDFTDVKSKKKDRKAVASVAGKERGTHKSPTSHPQGPAGSKHRR